MTIRGLVRPLIRSLSRDVEGGVVSLASQATSYLNGVAPYHWLDFINNRALYAGIDVGDVTQATGYSFSRASQGYYQNADGTLTSFASGAMRRGDRGVLIEGARTNLALRSQEFDDATWQTTGTIGSGVAPTRTANQGVAPDGTTTADRVQFSLAGGTASGDISLLRQSITVTSGQTYATSVWLKSNDSNSYAMQLQGSGSAATAITVTPTWQRFVTTAASVSTTDTPAVRLRGAQTPTNSNTADILMWGFQHELGAFPSSYIPTTTASATRAADTLVYTAGLTYPLGLWAEFERAVDTGADEAIVQVRDTATERALLIGALTATDATQLFAIAGGSTTGSSAVAGAVPLLTPQKIAGRFAVNDFIAVRNGTLGGADVSGAVPTTPSTFAIGHNNGSNQPFGYIRRASGFNFGPTDAQLQLMAPA